MNNIYNKYYEGILYNPEKEQKIIATLYIDEKGKVTISSLQNLSKDNSVSMNKIDSILGFISENNTGKNYSIKLFDVYQTFQSISSLDKYKYISNTVYLSETHDKNICENDKYRTLMLTSNRFDKWIKISGFDLKIKDYEKFELSQYYKKPAKINLFKNSDIEVYIYFRAKANLLIKRVAKIEEEVFLNVDFYKSLQREEIMKLQLKIDRLLSLFLDTTIQSKIEIKTDDKIVYQFIKKNNNYTENSFSCIIDFDIFRNNSQNIFNNWFFKQEKLNLLLKNYFSVFNRIGVLVENKFLTYVSILENYYKNEYKAEKNLHNKLIEIFNNSSISSKIENIEEYTKIIKTTRNYHTHLEEKHRKNSLTTEGLIKTNKILEFIIRELLLRELGLNNVIKCNSCSFDILKN